MNSGNRQRISIEIAEPSHVDELVLGYRTDGTLHELATLEPPATAKIRAGTSDSL